MLKREAILAIYKTNKSYSETARLLGISRQRVHAAVTKSYISYWTKRTKELREKAVIKLGSKCFRCGFSDTRALQIDHVHGGGKKDIKKRAAMARYKEVIEDTTGKYQLLCANCNWIKREENNEK